MKFLFFLAVLSMSSMILANSPIEATPLLEATYETYDSDSEQPESTVYGKTCKFFPGHHVITSYTGDASSEAYLPAEYSAAVIKKLISLAQIERLITKRSSYCRDGSTQISAFRKNKQIILKESIFCNSHSSQRKGLASKKLLRFVHLYCGRN